MHFVSPRFKLGVTNAMMQSSVLTFFFNVIIYRYFMSFRFSQFFHHVVTQKIKVFFTGAFTINKMFLFFSNLVRHSLSDFALKKKAHIEAIKWRIKFAAIVCSGFDSRFIAKVLKFYRRHLRLQKLRIQVAI